MKAILLIFLGMIFCSISTDAFGLEIPFTDEQLHEKNQTMFAQNIIYPDEFQCDIKNELDLKKNLQTNPAVKQFLDFHPSSAGEVYYFFDDLGNPVTQVQYAREGLLLSVAIDENDENCFVQRYEVAYDIPTAGIGVSLTHSNYFESDKIQKVISAVKDLTNPHKQMKKGIPLYQIKCKEGLVPIVKVDRIKPACVTDATWNVLLERGWTPLRVGMPAETNILITYNATMVYPQKVTKEYMPGSPYFNMIFFVNNDISPHTINAIDESWSTGVIEPGKLGSMSFNDTTSYQYYVAERPGTTGRIIFESNSHDQMNPSPEPKPDFDPIPEKTSDTSVSDTERYISPFDEELIHEFQKYHTVITGKVVEWYGQKQPSKYYYQYRVEALAHHTPRMQDDSIYIVMGDEDSFIPVDAEAVLFGLNVDMEGTLYIEETAVIRQGDR